MVLKLWIPLEDQDNCSVIAGRGLKAARQSEFVDVNAFHEDLAWRA